MVTDVRRSNRLEHKMQGFKSIQCADNKCFGCSSSPPTLSNRVIRNLGETLCKISSNQLTDEALSATKKTKYDAIGSRPDQPEADNAKQKKGEGCQRRQSPRSKRRIVLMIRRPNGAKSRCLEESTNLSAASVI